MANRLGYVDPLPDADSAEIRSIGISAIDRFFAFEHKPL
jgi:hypothetical protein